MAMGGQRDTPKPFPREEPRYHLEEFGWAPEPV